MTEWFESTDYFESQQQSIVEVKSESLFAAEEMKLDWYYYLPIAQLSFDNDIVGFMAIGFSVKYGSSGCLMPIWRNGVIGNF